MRCKIFIGLVPGLGQVWLGCKCEHFEHRAGLTTPASWSTWGRTTWGKLLYRAQHCLGELHCKAKCTFTFLIGHTAASKLVWQVSRCSVFYSTPTTQAIVVVVCGVCVVVVVVRMRRDKHRCCSGGVKRQQTPLDDSSGALFSTNQMFLESLPTPLLFLDPNICKSKFIQLVWTKFVE